METVRCLKTPEVVETYKANGIHAVVVGKYRTCHVKPIEGGHYERVTQTGSKHSRRYEWYPTYEAAIEGALNWGARSPR